MICKFDHAVCICGKSENDYCPIKPLKPLTNEEWFNGLSITEKAKWLSRHSQYMYSCGEKQTIPKTMYEEDWEFWLKARHEE